jgi:hypothetical protein
VTDKFEEEEVTVLRPPSANEVKRRRLETQQKLAGIVPHKRRSRRRNGKAVPTGMTALERERAACPPESEEQEGVAKYLKSRSDMREKWCHVANERKATVRQRARLSRQGVQKGVPDILIFKRFTLADSFSQDGPRDAASPLDFTPCDYVGLAIELKRRKPARSKISPEQRVRLQALREEGWIAVICYGRAEARALIELCYGPRPHTIT